MVPNPFHMNVPSTAGDPSLDLWMDGNWSNGFSTPPTQSVPLRQARSWMQISQQAAY